MFFSFFFFVGKWLASDILLRTVVGFGCQQQVHLPFWPVNTCLLGVVG